MLLSVLVDGSTNSLGNAVYDCCNSRFDVASHGVSAETNPNMRLQFQLFFGNLAVLKSFAASLDRFVCQFS